MEKMSRMAKYKELREGMKTDVISDEATSTYTENQKNEPVRDADYYKRFLASEDMTQIKTAHDADLSTTQPMTYDNVNAQVDEDLERALTKVREEAGQEEYNTRMDILNKIRQARLSEEEALSSTDSEAEEAIAEDEKDDDFEDEEDDDFEDEEDEEETSRQRFGFFKRHQEDDDDDDDDAEDGDYDDDDEDEQPHKHFSLFHKHDNDDDAEDGDYDDDDDDDDDEQEGNSLFVKVLNVVIVILGLVLVALVAYIVKEFFL